MTTKRDLEYWAFEFTEYIEANYNTKITALNTEKDDSLSLSEINSNAFFYLQEEDSFANYDVFVTFVIESEFGETVASTSAQTVQVPILVTIPRELEANPKNILKKAFRYRRALLDCIEGTRKKYHSLDIKDIPAMPLVSQTTQKEYLTIGLEVSFSFA